MSSSLIVEVCQIEDLKSHNNADSLELSIIKGWQCIVKKGQYKKGDKVIFIPPDALIPDDLANSLNLRNYLAGQNRVKCVRLRGEMSFGLIIDIPEGKNWEIGYNCADDLKITKYEPPVRLGVGDIAPNDPHFIKYTDIENGRNYPNIFKEGEMVVATEKLDGSSGRLNFSISSENNSNIESNLIENDIQFPRFEYKAGSHNLNRKRPEDDNYENSIYWFPYSLENIRNLIQYLHSEDPLNPSSVTVYGELWGKVHGGIKSMNYGKPNSINFSIFDIMVNGKYLNFNKFAEVCNKFSIQTVPLVEIFSYSLEKALKLSTGESILAKENGVSQIREGIVIKPIEERSDPKLGRVILKILSDDYLLLKNKKSDKGEITDYKDE